jgi:hypothetical protein
VSGVSSRPSLFARHGNDLGELYRSIKRLEETRPEKVRKRERR